MNSQEIISNGETFKLTTYNGISVMIDLNGFYNASKICKDNGTKFLNITRNKYWSDYLDEISGVLNFETTQLIVEKLEFSNDVKGIYIHPKLVNYLCMHVNYKYAILVGEIMDLYNQKILENNSTLENEIKDLKELAVPKKTNNKKLRIMKIEDNLYKISGDSSRSDNKLPYPVIKTYVFASSMNVRQKIIRDKVVKNFKFTDLEAFDTYIKSNFTILYEK